jgi:hypothetical protein
MVHPAGVEPAAYGIGIRHSIQLSYGCIWWDRQILFSSVQRFFYQFSAKQFPAAYFTAFLCLKLLNDFSGLHERQFIPAGCKGRTPEFAARPPV